MATVKESPMRNEVRALAVLAVLEGPKAVSAVKSGLPAGLLRPLAVQLGLSLEELGEPLHLTGRTLHRRLEEGRLALDESERLFALIRIFALAKETLGGEAKAVHWLKSPLPVLNGQTPLECAENQIGLREIEDVLIRIEDVVYS